MSTTSTQSLWEDHKFLVKITGDGSPSLKYLGSEHDESMHHSGGAWSETDYIYGNALRAGMDQGARTVLSVGLGLAYNEMLSVKLALERNIEILLHSYEKDNFLSEHFSDFIKNPNDEVYKSILGFVNAQKPQELILEKLRGMLRKEDFIILGPLNLENILRRYQVILYDAFSSKATPELWREDFLNEFLRKAADDKCIVSTYACTGSLKQSLKAQGFQVHERLGFQGKRSSLIGNRGFNLTPD